ncbi:hypothetical protein [Viscerimonas tarda]
MLIKSLNFKSKGKASLAPLIMDCLKLHFSKIAALVGAGLKPAPTGYDWII